jgi:hypothetical protein
MRSLLQDDRSITQPLDQLVKPKTEIELVRIIVEHRNIFGPIGVHAIEVRSHGTSRLDIALLADKKLIGIEAKLANWGKAIAQATCNKYCVDESFIGIWEGKYLNDACKTAKRFGIGVLAIGPRGVWIASAPRLQHPDASLRSNVIAQLSKGL